MEGSPIGSAEVGHVRLGVPSPRMPLTSTERLSEAERIFGGPSEARNALQLVPGAFDLEIVNAIAFPHPSLAGPFESGCAEPWTSNVVASLLIASNQRTVLETGSFVGYTSAWLALALERMGGGTFTAVDIDPERAKAAQARLDGLGLTRVSANVVTDDVLHYLTTIPDQSIGFAWIDDYHEHYHVAQEINLLWRKMKPGGIMCGHDVYGSCDLQQEFRRFGGYAIDLPRLGPAGGIGIIQVPK